jgi:hypothetical protein
VCGVDECGAGAERGIGADRGSGLLIRGELTRPVAGVRDVDDPDILDPCATGEADGTLSIRTGIVWTFVVTDPSCLTCCETLARLRMLPRGMPKPAESSRITTLLAAPAAATDGPRWTTIVLCADVAGGCNGMNCRGGFITLGTVFQARPEPPGCQPQP